MAIWDGPGRGMRVRTADGEELGRIVEVDGEELVLEKGFFFPRTYRLDRRDVDRCEDGEVWLCAARHELSFEPHGEPQREPSDRERSGGDRRETGQAPELGAWSEEVRVPVVEEELLAEKHVREVGAVRLRKTVVTEQRQLTVPVRREEISIERVAARGATSRDAGDAGAFEGQTFSIPLYEEEVEVVKRPRVREVVRVTKTVRHEERVADATVRRTVVDVDPDDATDDEPGRGEPH